MLSGGRVFILRSSLQLEAVSLPVSARALALGSFMFDRKPGLQMAISASDGSIQIAVHNEFDPRAYTVEEFNAIRRAKLRNEPPLLPPATGHPVNGWKIVESFPGVASFEPGHPPALFRTRISSNGADDLMMLNAFGGQLAVISHPDQEPGATTPAARKVSIRPDEGSPVAALPLRVNIDGRPGSLCFMRARWRSLSLYRWRIPRSSRTASTIRRFHSCLALRT